MTIADAYQQAFKDLTTPRPTAEYHEDMGPVLWWRLPIVEPPWVGTPNDIGGWPDYHTHWTPLPQVVVP